MSWTVIKELNEKRAKAFADAQALRDGANKEDRDLTTDEETRHAALLGDVDNYAKRIAREQSAAALGETLEQRNQVGREDVDSRETRKSNSYGMPQKDWTRYSICRAISKRINNEALDGVEAEVSKEIEKRTGKAPQGFYFPTEVGMSNRTILDTTQGSGAIPTTTSPNFIEALRNRIVTLSLGATLMPDMTGNFSLPKQTAVSTAYWVAEGNAPTASYQTVGQVAFTPKTVGAYTDISRKFINQSVFSAEEFVRNDLARVLGIAIELGALYGLGSSNQPLGIVTNIQNSYTGQIHSIGTNGGAAAFTDVVALETLVAAANADLGSLAYVTNAKVRGALKTTAKSVSSVAAGFVWDDGEVNGYPAAVTNVVPSNGTKASGTGLSGMIFGNWESLVYALWGGLDILVDPYTGGNAGTVRINALQDIDINVRHPESFSICTDIVA